VDFERIMAMHRALHEDGRYALPAYDFLHSGLERAVARAQVACDTHGSRHVDGRQLSEAIRELAVERWGALASTVLAGWNIHSTRDFGEMVFMLVRLGMLGRQESDRVEDFDNVYTFAGAFDTYSIPVDRLEDSPLSAV
jgi:uncharacterized repeat protein (TIGR04138 family)